MARMMCGRKGCKFEAAYWVAYKDQPEHVFRYCYGHWMQFWDPTGEFAPGLTGGQL